MISDTSDDREGQSSSSRAARAVAVPPVLCVVAGTGSIGARHLSAIQHALDLPVMALPMRSERRADLASRGFAVADSWEDARERGATHAIIATTTSRHRRDAEAALAAGFRVLVEKPMALDAREARNICAAARADRQGLWVACCLRFNWALERFRERLPELGRVHAVRIECQSYLPDWRPERPYNLSYSASATEGGVLRDLIHEIDYAGWLFGWPRALQARVEHHGRLGLQADEAADLFWETHDHVAVSLRLDYLSRPAHRSMRAFGEHGVLEWDGIAGTVAATIHGRENHDRLARDRDDMYIRQARAFLAATPDDFDSRMATAEDGVRALAICDAARVASSRRAEAEVRY